MKNKTKGLLAAYGMVLPAFLVVMLTVAYPIVSAVIQSFQDEDTGHLPQQTIPTFLPKPHRETTCCTPCLSSS